MIASAIVLAKGVDHCRAEVEDDEYRGLLGLILGLGIDRCANRDKLLHTLNAIYSISSLRLRCSRVAGDVVVPDTDSWRNSYR